MDLESEHTKRNIFIYKAEKKNIINILILIVEEIEKSVCSFLPFFGARKILLKYLINLNC